LPASSGYAVSKIAGYKELFLNPYENESVSNVTTMLSNDWEITDGAGLKEWLEKLKSGEGEYKAWDWARGVNIAWAGLRAGYITREEVDAYNASLVPLAQAKYADWNAYFDDFLAGCKDFDPEDTYGTAEEILEHMQNGISVVLAISTVEIALYKGTKLTPITRPHR